MGAEETPLEWIGEVSWKGMGFELRQETKGLNLSALLCDHVTLGLSPNFSVPQLLCMLAGIALANLQMAVTWHIIRKLSCLESDIEKSLLFIKHLLS